MIAGRVGAKALAKKGAKRAAGRPLNRGGGGGSGAAAAGAGAAGMASWMNQSQPITGVHHTERGWRGRLPAWPFRKKEPPAPPAPRDPIWTPTSVTGSGAGLMTAAAVTGGAAVTAVKAPSLFAEWAPRIIVGLGGVIILGIIIYYTLIRKTDDKDKKGS